MDFHVEFPVAYLAYAWELSGSGGKREVASGRSNRPLKPKDGLTPISCHAVLERYACAPFIKERRMECINATNLRRKSGQMGHPAFVAGIAKTIVGRCASVENQKD
jgi:hypothetical protein